MPRLTHEEFVRKAKEVHGDKYDYSVTIFTRTADYVEINCPEHGSFKQRASNHLAGRGCKKCSGVYMDKEYFIEKAQKVHGNKYLYEKVEYECYSEKVEITCKVHGSFMQSPSNHLAGHGCSRCAGIYSDRDLFIEKARKIHGDLYSYEKVEYINWVIKVEIICSEHGSFFQSPNNHQRGDRCPSCKRSKGEEMIAKILDQLGVKYTTQKSFPTCRLTRLLYFDFYLPEYNLCLEYDGRQHTQPVDKFGGEEEFKLTQERDQFKNKWCQDNGVLLHRINHKEKDLEGNITTLLNTLPRRKPRIRIVRRDEI